MSSECIKEVVIKCKKHNFVVTNWVTKGGHQKATQLRCSVCLMPVCLQELESKEWREQENV